MPAHSSAVVVTVTTGLVPALTGGREGDAVRFDPLPYEQALALGSLALDRPVTSLGTHRASVAGGRRVVELVEHTPSA